MSAPSSLVVQNYLSQHKVQQDKNNNNNNDNLNCKMNSTGASSGDLIIERKFNELAKKIFDELKQTSQRSDFLQAIDQILSEPSVKRHNIEARRLLLKAKRKSRQQQQQQQQQKQHQVTTISSSSSSNSPSRNAAAANSADAEALKRQYDLILEKQRQQQEQLDSHQQILFDSQYRSLPSEITEAVASHEQRRANLKAVASTTNHQRQPLATHSSNNTNKLSIITNGNPAATTRPSSDNDKTSPVKSQKSVNSSAGRKRQAGVVSSSSSSNISSIRLRSAIPQSTILSGIQQQKVEPTSYPLAKSATTTGATTTTSNGLAASPGSKKQDGLVRQASLKINKQTREAQREFIKNHTTGAAATTASVSLTASEKLRQRRPTRASIGDPHNQQLQAMTSDDSDLDCDDDDDDEEFEYDNLAARRAYLNERFVGGVNQGVEINKSKTLSDASKTSLMKQATTATDNTTRSLVSERRSPSQQTTTTKNCVSQVAKQKQRFSAGGAPIVRSSTIGAPSSVAGANSSYQRPVVVTSRPTSRNATNYRGDNADESHQQQHYEERQEPRSLGGLLTSHDIGQLYKPHMNYSTSLLGNHRLSDDDEIIIIPTAQSPSSLLSASVSPDHRQYHSHQQSQSPSGYGGQLASGGGVGDQPDQSTNNMDEFSERFSISRTKSFWEKLANSKKGPQSAHIGGGEHQQQQQDKQYFNTSSRSIASSSGGTCVGGPNLVAVDAKSSQSSLLNAHETDLKLASAAANSAHNHQHQHYPAAMKSAFDRMDSTGGSGNSHYSGCSSSSSTSGDEQTSGYGRTRKPKSNEGSASNRAPKVNPTINQLIRQDELSRTDRFRQTR